MRRRLFLLVPLLAAVISTLAAASTSKKKLTEAKLPTEQAKIASPARASNAGTNRTTTDSVRVKQLLVAINPAANQSQPVESRTGKMLARVQGKRQTNAADAPSRRNEDPWFLDQSPYPLQPYRFVYNIKGKNGQTEQYRQEVGDGKFLTGSYGYVLPDGIYRHVDYIADDRGFRAFIRTSEPGTANQNPANVVIQANPVVQPPGQTYSSLRAPDSLPVPAPTFGPPDVPALVNNYNGIPLSSSLSAGTVGADFGGAGGSGGGGSSEIRRAPGSIVNNALSPANNFSTFGFPSSSFQSSSLGLGQPLLPAANFGSRPPSSDFSNTLVSRFGPANQSSSSLAEPTINNWPSSISDELAFARISRQRALQPSFQPLAEPASSSTLTGRQSQSQSQSQELRPRFSAESIPGRDYFAPIERPATSFGANTRLAYDTPLSVQGNLGPNKLAYDNKHVLHPNLPYLSLERARSLAQIDQLNALNPGYIRALPNLGSPASSLDLANLGLLQPVQRHFSSSSHSMHSKQEEHHHRHQVSSEGQQDSRSPESDSAPTTKEHRTGSGSVREFEHHRAIQHGLPPPPAPTFSGQSTFQSRPPSSQHIADTGVKGGGASSSSLSGNGRLLAPYASLSQQQQQQQRDEHLSDDRGGSDRHSGAVKGGMDGPVPPAAPVPPVEPSPPASPALDIETTTSPPPEPDQRQSSGSVKGGASSSSSSVNEREKRRPQEPFAWFHSLPPSDPPKPLQQQQQHISSLSAPVRSVRMPGEMDYRSTILMNDLRSMQNMIGLPQPPRLNRHSHHSGATSSLSSPDTPSFGRTTQTHHLPADGGGSGGDLHTNLIRSSSADASSTLADERLNGGLNSADRMVSARMSRLEALMERAGQLQRQQQQQQQQNSTGSNSAGRAASVQRASIAQIESPPPVSGKPAAAAASDDGGDQIRRFSTGLVQRSPPNVSSSLLNELSLEDNLVKAANETFDAHRLSQAKRLQAEKVSELEKFQQRLRAQQLFLEHSKIESPKAPSSSGSLPAAAPRANARSSGNDLLNSHVKYDEDSVTDSLKPPVFKSLEPRDFPRIRRQPESSESGDKDLKAQPAKKSLQSSTIEENQQQQRQRKLTILQAGSAAAKNNTEGEQKPKQNEPSEFARQIQRWPSIVTGQIVGNSNKSLDVEQQNSVDTSSWPGDKKKLAPSSLVESTTGGAQVATEKQTAKNQTSSWSVQQQQHPHQAPPNMNFLNSVASLSAHQLNPFSSAGVNLQQPARDSSQEISSQPAHRANNSTSSAQLAANSQMGVATTSARYFSSPELLAALDYHEQRDTSSRLRSVLLPSSSSSSSPSSSSSSSPAAAADSSATPTGATTQTSAASRHVEPTTLVSWASNHRHHRSAGAPYARNQSAAGAIIASESARDSPQQQQQQQQQKHQVSGAGNQQQPTTVQASSGSGVLSRDGFDIRDRSVQVDDERFYEVVSSAAAPAPNHQQQPPMPTPSHPTGWGQFQAFRDAQLSIPALAAS